MPDTEELLPDAEPEIHDDVATKHKLKGLVDSFPGFDGDMREGTRQRREKEQAKVAAMRMEMSRLEAALTEQTQLRAEMNETIQKYCDEQLVKMTEQFESLLEHQTTRARQLATRATRRRRGPLAIAASKPSPTARRRRRLASSPRVD